MRHVPLAILLLVCAPAHAGEAKIVLLSQAACCPAEAWPEAEKAAVQELEGYDFTVEIVEDAGPTDKDRHIELLEAAKKHDAVCALRIVKLAEGGGVDLWIIDRVTGKMVYRQIPLSVEDDPESSSIVALRVVELLRASLLELELPDVTLEMKPPQPALEVIDRARPEKPEGPLGLLTGASLLGSPTVKGSTGVLGAINWIVSYRPIAQLAIELEGLVTFASTGISEKVEEERKSTTFDLAMARAWFLWYIRPTGIVRPVLGAGAGLLVPWSKTTTSAGREKKEYALVAYVGGTLMVVFALTRSFWIRTSFKIGAALPEQVEIYFNDTNVASFGHPIIEGQLLMEFRIP